MKTISVWPVPEPPPLGCYYRNQHHTDQPHRLTFAGWVQAANPKVAIPLWECTCGERTYGHRQTRRVIP